MSIIIRAEHWSLTRGITRQKPCVNGFIANITDELGEWLVAQKNKDEDESIDAVADITVFSLTELFKLGVTVDPSISTLLSGKEYFSKWYMSLCKVEDSSRNEFNRSIIHQLGLYELNNQPLGSPTQAIITDIIIECLQKMTTMGYNPILVMDEVLKVVESRVGKWDEVNSKFQKDTSPEAKANWYTPNYTRARRK